MNELEIQRRRIKLLKAAIDKISNGNKTAFARRLGYKDGAFIRQMLSGDRAIREKTINLIESLPGMKGWFRRDAEEDDQQRYIYEQARANSVTVNISLSQKAKAFVKQLTDAEKNGRLSEETWDALYAVLRLSAPHKKSVKTFTRHCVISEEQEGLSHDRGRKRSS